MNRLPEILLNSGYSEDGSGGLTGMTIPSTVSTLNEPTEIITNASAFSWLPKTTTNLQTYTLTSSSISTSIFIGYNKVEQFNITNATSLSGEFARDCTELATVNAPNLTLLTGTSESGRGLFRGCSKLKTLNMPNLTIINDDHAANETGMFYGCSALESINFPNLDTLRGSVSWPSGAFSSCRNLTTVNLPKIKTIQASWGGPFCGDGALKSVTLGSSGNPVTSIGSYAFRNCTQSGLTITIYTSDGNVISGSPWGATNATIVWEEA